MSLVDEIRTTLAETIVKVKKRCILACKTFLKDGATRKMFNC